MGNIAFSKTDNGEVIFSGQSVTSILEVSITAGGFVAVTLDASCKSVYITTRDGADFLLSNVEAGTTYSTLPGGIAIDITGVADQVLFYAKGTSSTTLEIMCID